MWRRSRRAAGFRAVDAAHGRGAPAPDLEAPAEGIDTRLPAANRCRGAHHRAQSVSRLGGERDGRCTGQASNCGRLATAAGGRDCSHPRGRSDLASGPRDERLADRAYGLQRYWGLTAPSLWLEFRDRFVGIEDIRTVRTEGGRGGKEGG